MSGKGTAKKMESLRKLKLSATMLEVGFKSENLGEIIQCQIELEELAARLQAEQSDLVTPEQCEVAKESLESFVALVDQAMEKTIREEDIPTGPARPKPTTLGK
jgi:hypothetical protein